MDMHSVALYPKYPANDPKNVGFSEKLRTFYAFEEKFDAILFPIEPLMLGLAVASLEPLRFC